MSNSRGHADDSLPFQIDRGVVWYFSLSPWGRVGVKDPNVTETFVFMESLIRPSATFSRWEKGVIGSLWQKLVLVVRHR